MRAFFRVLSNMPVCSENKKYGNIFKIFQTLKEYKFDPHAVTFDFEQARKNALEVV